MPHPTYSSTSQRTIVKVKSIDGFHIDPNAATYECCFCVRLPEMCVRGVCFGCPPLHPPPRVRNTSLQHHHRMQQFAPFLPLPSNAL